MDRHPFFFFKLIFDTMQKIENIFENTTKVDTRKKLNRVNKEVDSKHLEAIERGVTLEELEAMTKDGLKIFKYKTQITIHGKFPKANNLRVNGYKNIIENKNKSIGVRYSAIDEGKRKRIAKSLKAIGFNYRSSSTSSVFEWIKAIDNKNRAQVIREGENILRSVNLDLFYGSIRMWVGSIWGQHYLIIDLVVNAIPEKNVQAFVDSMGATDKVVKAYHDKKDREHQAWVEEYKQKLDDEKSQREQQYNKHSDDINYLKENFEFVKGEPSVGEYIEVTFDYKNNLVFKKTVVHLPSTRSKVTRKASENFSDLKSAIEKDVRTSSYDQKIRRINAFKIS